MMGMPGQGYPPQGMQQYGQQQMGMPRRWHGHYEQFNSNHDMELMLIVDFMSIRGEGQDQIGAFDINGQCQGDNFTIIKQYRGKHAVHYHGHFEQGREKMEGHWGMQHGHRDGSLKLKMNN